MRSLQKKKKRSWKKVLSGMFMFMISMLVMSGIAISVSADESVSGNGEEQLNQNIIEQIERLDTEELQAYIDSLGTFPGESVGERLLSYIGGEEFDYGGFAVQIISVLFENVKDMIPAFACICGIALLCGLISALQSSFADRSTAQIIFLAGFAAVLIPALSVLTECFFRTVESVESMQKQMQIVFPLLLTLMSAGGGGVSAAICRPAVAFLSTTIVSLVTSVVLPFTLVVVAFSIAGNLSGELRLGNFASFFKSINKWIMGVSVSVFGLFFTVQGLTSAAYDGITRRAAKYAIGTGVPIVGGFLSGGFDLAVAGTVLIKNSLGSLGVFLLASVLFEPLVLLLAANLFLRLSAAVTQPLGDSRISSFLSETADNLNYCTAGLLFVAFLYFIVIVLAICSSEAIL